jgi:CRP-like cAMP-binding protein
MSDDSNPHRASVLAELAELPVGAVLGRDHLERLAQIGAVEELPVGTSLFRQGAPADKLRLVVSGRISLAFEIPGGEPMVLGALSRGDMLGWSALRGWAEPSRWTASASASKASRVLSFPGPELRELCEQDHELGFYMMRHAFEIVARRLADCRVRLLDVYGSGVG